ncbi:D-galactarate dehydratase GarD [Clostridium aceticum]|uniref:Galactarate dehydratase n=1 Tax=Clostridium aceticum TaxID=84022 RepID=A0A0D8I8B5_9CLOT|nr:galactarate dehydratase [Clostridium aceticum]AKL94607.1 D-galactarate dehydratase GarD [Clostridium aceticum]KJF26488.1 galactarate dehydrogenase [Clostridium aceticum]
MGNEKNQKPLLIKVHPIDNVEIVVNEEGIAAGTIIADDLTATEDIPQSHKIALIDFKAGDEIVRYGEVIGYAKEDILKGSWIDEHKVKLPQAPVLEELPVATKVPAPMLPLEGYTFLGYRNPNGSVGTKNMLGITTSVQCVEGVLNIAVNKIKKELLPNYPNVDGVVPINHAYGCGVAIHAPEAIIPIRTLRNLAMHPNFGGELLVVGLGCEKLLPDKLFPDIKEENVITLQEEMGFEAMIERILEKAKEGLERLNQRSREVCPASELVIGLQCGGSDAFSGVTSNPAVGYAADLLVRAGASVIFSEVSEVRDGVHLLTPRAINEEVGQKLKDEMAWYDNYLDAGCVDRDANPSPGNKEGGLANIVEKSLGSIAKSGSSAIVDVLSPGEKVEKKGLIYAATPASDFVCGTCQLASGITLQVFTSGRGTTYGLAMAPVIKVSSRTVLANKWKDLIDVDAGKIATGEATIEDVGQEIFELILEIASGKKKAWADYWGIENALCLFNPAPVT